MFIPGWKARGKEGTNVLNCTVHICAGWSLPLQGNQARMLACLVLLRKMCEASLSWRCLQLSPCPVITAKLLTESIPSFCACVETLVLVFSFHSTSCFPRYKGLSPLPAHAVSIYNTDCLQAEGTGHSASNSWSSWTMTHSSTSVSDPRPLPPVEMKTPRGRWFGASGRL